MIIMGAPHTDRGTNLRAATLSLRCYFGFPES